jgi:threonine dehydratase
LADIPIGLADVELAARRLAGVAVRTPLLSSVAVDEMVGARVLAKAESLQRGVRGEGHHS